MSDKPQRKLIGHIGVDSGSMMFSDPCYVKSFDGNASPFSIVQDLNAHLHEEPLEHYPYDYGGATGASCNKNQAGMLTAHPEEQVGEAVVVRTGWGDGMYPVYVEYDKQTGRVARATIEFITPEEEEAEW